MPDDNAILLDTVPFIVVPPDPSSRANASIIPFGPQQSGAALMVVAIDSVEKSAPHHIDAVISWWESSIIRSNNSIRPSELLETLCRDFNASVFSMTGKDTLWLPKLHILCALYSDQMLHIAQSGNTTAWLVRNRKIRNIAATDPASTPSERVFTDITSGQLALDDRLLITTPSLFDVISLETVEHTLTHLNLDQSLELWTRLYPSDTPGPSLACIIGECALPQNLSETESPPADSLSHRIIAARPFSGSPSKKHSVSISYESMHELNALEKRTGKLLVPTNVFEIKKFFARIEKRAKRLWAASARWSPSSPLPPESRTAVWSQLKHTVRAFAVYPFSLARAALSLVLRFVNNPKQFITQEGKAAATAVKNLPHKTAMATVSQSKSLFIRFTSLPRRQQAILALSCFIAITLLSSIIVLARNRHLAQIDTDIRSNLASIRGELAAAEASLIYQEEAKARRLVDHAASSYAALRNIPPSYQTTLDELKQLIEKLTQKVFRIVTIEEPPLLTDLSIAELGDEAPADPRFLIAADSLLFTLNQRTNHIIALAADSGEATSFSAAPPASGRIQLLRAYSQGTLIGLQGNLFLFYSTDEDTWETVPVPDISSKMINAFSPYQNRIYFIDESERQLFRSDRRGASFTAPRTWLDTPLAAPSRMLDIDGQVYVGHTDGIEKFDAGSPVTFALDTLSPPLSITEFKLLPESSRLYALDAFNRRLVAFDKDNGALIAQYTSPWFDDLKNFEIAAGGDRAFILNGSRIFVLDLTIEP